MPTSPSLRIERALLRSGATLVGGMDEVGRGALGGPVSVGVVVVDGRSRSLPGVRDSKLLPPDVREELAPVIRRWAVDCAVGHATAAEIDAAGIIGALRMAGLRALAALRVVPDAILLDGSHDWLSPPMQSTLFDEGAASEPLDDVGAVEELPAQVHLQVKADLSCTSVAAASVLAKVERDGRMRELHRLHPGYGWAENKGYASAGHRAALERLGPCVEHRRSWRLPGVHGA